MRVKLTVTIDERVVPAAKRYAQRQGLSLSRVIEQALRDISAEGTPTFSMRWRAQFKASRRKDARYTLLAKKYL